MSEQLGHTSIGCSSCSKSDR